MRKRFFLLQRSNPSVSVCIKYKRQTSCRPPDLTAPLPSPLKDPCKRQLQVFEWAGQRSSELAFARVYLVILWWFKRRFKRPFRKEFLEPNESCRLCPQLQPYSSHIGTVGQYGACGGRKEVDIMSQVERHAMP